MAPNHTIKSLPEAGNTYYKNPQNSHLRTPIKEKIRRNGNGACMYDKETLQRLPNHNLEDENLSLPEDDLISKKTMKEEGSPALFFIKMVCAVS